MEHHPLIIIGAGPAGLAAAYESMRQGIRPLILERSDKVGGLARTEVHQGYRFDIGGHRFYTQIPEVQQLWEEMLGEDFSRIPRLSRIYYQNRFFKYPIDFFDALAKLGLAESLLILLSYLRALCWPSREEDNFEQWVTNRFGRRLYRTFFQTYTEKVWGIPCLLIQADWAAQRIKGLSLKSALAHALFGNHNTRTLIDCFYYPVLGPGMMWERFQQELEKRGNPVLLNHRVQSLKREGRHLREITVQHGATTAAFSAEHFISSMPLTELIRRLQPAPPVEVRNAAEKLTYRDFILVGLIIHRAEVFPDHWIYVHSPDVKMGRIQNFKNWSAAMVPDLRTTSLGIEYFCNQDDGLWALSDQELIALATRELARLGLTDPGEVEAGVVFRQPRAYPVYLRGYQEHLQVIQDFLATIDNLQTIGRNGMHRYNNMDHSMLTGMTAIRNLLGEMRNLWSINSEVAHHEEMETGICR